ncbi:MAG: PDC sensor domain-containing protein, partial [Proteobacteria bacterium]|nr:PDC sensor domain-containing protein [Pseudomonadota bacterium]
YAEAVHGAIDITTLGDITAGAEGIYALAAGGGSVTIDLTGDILQSTTGISAMSADGAIQVDMTGDINSSGRGIFAQSANAAVTVNQYGTIQAGGDGIHASTTGDDDGILIEALKRYPGLECLYILDENGVQTTETYCSGAKLLRRPSPLFRPAPKGTDQSLKDYFLLIQAGLPQFASEPYISRASGSLCLTVSRVFESVDGRRCVLCADFDCGDVPGITPKPGC